MAYSENEAQISELMNTYMYTDFNGAPDGSSLSEALHRMESDGNYADNDYYKILRDAVDKNPEYGKLVIGNQSCNMSDFNTNGTVACTVTDPSTQTNYVVYRGTNDGEWLDNAEGMTKEHTIQQERAANYFDKVAEKNGWTQDDNIVVTGHSKGGNKAQYVTMAANYRDLIDTAYPIDGQGFSQEAIDSWKSRYGEDQ